MSIAESNTREPTPSKTEAMYLRMSARCDRAVCVIVAIVLVVLVVSGCSRALGDSLESSCPPAPDGSGRLSEYFRGYIEYSYPFSDNVIPIRVELKRPRSSGLGALDDTVSKGVEDEDEFVMELRDVLGRSLKSINFYVQPYLSHIDPDPEALEENPDMVTWFKSAYFDIFVRNPIDYTSVAILYEGNELEIQEHSANTPCLSVSWPTESQTFDENDHIPISFEATDADGDELSYTISYSYNGGRFYRWKKTATIDNPLSSVMISAADLESSDQARLAVSVTDGKRSMVWESPVFSVVGPPVPATTIPVNQPPVAVDDFVEIEIWETLEIDVLANDIDPEGNFEDHSIVIDEFPVLGTAELRREYVPQQAGAGFSPPTDATWKPVIAYMPGPSGVDALVYSVCDSEGLCDSAQVTIETGIADCTIMGTEDSETLTGTSGDDVICGLGGDDTINAGGGDDVIKAGAGDDTVLAGAGDDTIFGETGNDTIDSGAGNDIARGGSGRDYIKGAGGADRLYGESGKNILDGGTGDDAIYGGKGNDRIWGGYGDDLIYGGMGNDTIWAGAGDDTIRDSRGHDIIYPGQGDDTITGTNSEDTIIEDSLGCLRLGKYSYQTTKTLLTLLFC